MSIKLPRLNMVAMIVSELSLVSCARPQDVVIDMVILQ